MLRLGALLLPALVAAACWVDFRKGLRCDEDADCDGLHCVGGTCTDEADGGLNELLLAPGVRLSWSLLEVIGNGGRLTPGTTVALRIHLHNSGSATAQGIGARLSSGDGSIASVGPTEVRFGNILQGRTACGVVSGPEGDCSSGADAWPVIHISSDAVVGLPLALRLIVEDARGSTGALAFPLRLTAKDERITIARVEIAEGALLPGNSAALRIRVVNHGALLHDVHGTLTSGASGVLLDDAALLAFGDLESGRERCGTITSDEAGSCSAPANLHPTLRLDTSIPRGTTVPLHLRLADVNGDVFDTPFALPIE